MKAMIVQGGWDGHEPQKVARRFSQLLEAKGYTVDLFDSLDAFTDGPTLQQYDLIVPVWTMGTLTAEQFRAVSDAVESGTGLAGCHGGMCDAFRENVDWQFMTGGQWVSHPGGDGIEYTVHIAQSSSAIVTDISDFTVVSEQYYLHIDPAIEVLAFTTFPLCEGPHSSNGPVHMPVVWTKRWGKGKIFYNSLGHHDDVFEIPEAQLLMERGFLWCSRTQQEG